MKQGLILERQRFTDKSIGGSFYADGEFICYSLERPWADNKPFVSCIPKGVYTLEPHEYKGKINTFALVNEELGVTHWQENHSTRYAILIHPANRPEELAGCIAPGLEYDVDLVIDSRDAFGLLYPYLKKYKKLEVV